MLVGVPQGTLGTRVPAVWLRRRHLTYIVWVFRESATC